MSGQPEKVVAVNAAQDDFQPVACCDADEIRRDRGGIYDRIVQVPNDLGKSSTTCAFRTRSS
jgi:hypothetical protein